MEAQEEERHHAAQNSALRATAAKHTQDCQNGRKTRHLDSVEMYSFVQSMGIDPVKESEMVWIAEEALDVQLPDGWAEHVDDRGRPYFFNEYTAESSWQHPMDDVFHDLVEYFRIVQEAGGFWLVEDRLAEEEERIRTDLADWQELFDEHGNKFYYNRQTEDSRVDDPRAATYHRLYTRIKLVQKMREHLPHLSDVPRPEDPEIERQRQLNRDEAERQTMVVIKMQASFRVLKARRKAKAMKERRGANVVPPQERHDLRLCLRTQGHGADIQEDLVFSLTTARREYMSAARLQAMIRGALARLRVKPMLAHHRIRETMAIRIQAWIRERLTKIENDNEKMRQQAHSKVVFQRVLHGREDRLLMEQLRADHRQLRHEGALHFQRCWRGYLGRLVANEWRGKRRETVLKIQNVARCFLAREKWQKSAAVMGPARFIFEPTQDQRLARFMPFSWQLRMLPIGFNQVLPRPKRPVDLFAGSGPKNWQTLAAIDIQRWRRGIMERRVFKSTIGKFREEDRIRKEWEAAKIPASVIIQRHARGMVIRKREIIPEKRMQRAKKNAVAVELIYNYARKVTEQTFLAKAIEDWYRLDAVHRIQQRWRLYSARKRAKQLYEETMWPLRTYMEFSATGQDTVFLTVQFFPNGDFDSWRFQENRGTGDEFPNLLLAMEEEIDSVAKRYLAEKKVGEESDEEESDDETREPSTDLFTNPSDSFGDMGGFSMENFASTFAVVDEESESDFLSTERNSGTVSTGAFTEPLEVPSDWRMHYGGTFNNGRFIRSKATSVEQLSEQDRNAIIADLEEMKKRKGDEIRMKRQKMKKIAAQKEQAEKMRKLEAKRLKALAAAGAVGGRGGLGATKVSQLPQLALQPLDSPTHKINKRLFLAEKRRHVVHHQQMHEFDPARTSPTFAAAMRPAPEAMPLKQVHKHIHHHHHGCGHEEFYPSDRVPSVLPSLVTKANPLQRSLSASSAGTGSMAAPAAPGMRQSFSTGMFRVGSGAPSSSGGSWRG